MAKIDSTPVTRIAAADLSAKQWCFGKETSTGVNVCSVAGERAMGVIGNPAKVGEGVDLYVDRLSKVLAGGTFNKGDELTTDANGAAVAAVSGNFINAIAGDAGVAGKLCQILPPGAAVKSPSGGGAGVAIVADAQTSPGVPVCYTFNIADGATANYDIVVDDKFEVLEIITIKTSADGGSGDQVIIQNGASAISDAISMNHTHKTVTRAATIDETHNVIAAAGTLRAAVTKATNGAVKILVLGVKRA